MLLKKISTIISPDLAIDLGTANIIVSTKQNGIIINEPAVVSIKTNKDGKKSLVAVGIEAKRMLGKTPDNIKAIRPMKDGVIADFDTTEMMINYFIQKAYKKNIFFKPKIVICIPHGVTPVEKNAVKEAAVAAGARDVYLIEEPLAAAIGAGLSVEEPNGNLIVDIGSGTTEIGLVSLGSLVLCTATRTAGDSFDNAIVRYIKQSYNLNIGESTAETIKIRIGCATKRKQKLVMDVKGRDNFGYLKTIQVDSEEIRGAISEPLKEIAESVKKLLEQMPPDLASDIIDNGVLLTGGGALLRGIDAYISRIIQLKVKVADEPLLAVARGNMVVLQNSHLLELIDNI